MKTKLVNLLILLVIFASTLVAITFLPDRVPVHFDIAGEVDRWGSKYEMLILPVVLAAIWMLGDKSVAFFTKNPRSNDNEKAESDARTNEKVMNTTLTAVSAFCAVMNFAVIYKTFSALGSYDLPEIDIIKIVTIMLGVLLVAMGNYMPKTRTNSLLGFRCGWTMYNEATWRKSNLFAGCVSMICGALFVLAGILLEGVIAGVISLVLMFIAIASMMIYAYVIYKKEKKDEGIS